MMLVGCGELPQWTEADRWVLASLSEADWELPDDPTNAVADDPAAAALGEQLFFAPELSGSGEFSCDTCHDPELAFTDGLALSEAAGVTGRSAPPVGFAVAMPWQFWDGRCDTLWCQAVQPLEAVNEMDGARTDLPRALVAGGLDSDYEALFGALPDVSDEARFPPGAKPLGDGSDADLAWDAMRTDDQDAVTAVLVDVVKAIAAYERTLPAFDSDFDVFVAELIAEGSSDAISASAQRGAALFVRTEGECHLCHNGPALSEGSFHNLGLGSRDWLDADDGRPDGVARLLADDFNAAGRWSDDPDGAWAARLDTVEDGEPGAFKVPSLRHVSKTGPYMHGGHFDTLDEVVAFYADVSTETPAVGARTAFLRTMAWSEQDQADLVAFLETL